MKENKSFIKEGTEVEITLIDKSTNKTVLEGKTGELEGVYRTFPEYILWMKSEEKNKSFIEEITKVIESYYAAKGIDILNNNDILKPFLLDLDNEDMIKTLKKYGLPKKHIQLKLELSEGAYMKYYYDGHEIDIDYFNVDTNSYKGINILKILKECVSQKTHNPNQDSFY